MTREEAKEILSRPFNMKNVPQDILEAHRIAIQALEHPEKNVVAVVPCGDCISRADAIKAMQDKAKKLKNEDTINGLCGAVAILFDMPSVTLQEPMQVDLEGDGYADGELVYDYGKCPKCGWEFEEGDKDWEQPYCCHCGQKLKWFDNKAESEDE